MAVVSYDSGKMRDIIGEYNYALGDIREVSSTMQSEVKNIKNNWSGDDAERAKPDLDAIVSQMQSIENNLEQIIAMFKEVDSNFNQLKY